MEQNNSMPLWKEKMNQVREKEMKACVVLAEETATKHAEEASEHISQMMLQNKKVAVGLCLGNLNVFEVHWNGALIEPAVKILVQHPDIINNQFCPDAIAEYCKVYRERIGQMLGVSVEEGRATKIS